MRRLDDFDRKGWHNVCEMRSGPEVEYMGLVNREDDADDRVVVRVPRSLRDVVVDRAGNVLKRNEEDDELTTLAEYWTLGRAGERWLLLSIEQDAEGAHHLDAPIVASPWSDEARLHDDAVTELAVADAVPDAAIGELVDVDYAGDARVQAMDLSVVDGRFAPAVLEAAARRAVEAWAEAVDGADAALERAATPEAAHALLYPRGTNTRLVVRGPRLAGAADRGARRRRADRRRWRSRPTCAAAATSRTATPSRCSRARRTARRRSPSAGRSRSATTPRRRGGSSRPPRWAEPLLLAVPNVSEGRDARRPRGDRRRVRRRRGARARRPRRRRPPPRRLHARGRSRASCTARSLAGARVAVERIDLTRARGRAPARGRARRRPDRAPHRRRARGGVRRGAAARPPARHRPRRSRSTCTARSRAGAREQRCGGPARSTGSPPTTARRDRTRPPAPRSSPPAPPLVAFNVELAPPATLDDAKRIAALIREGGEEGLPGVRALGLQLASTGLVQISTNIEDPARATAGMVVAAVARHAAVSGAELVGLAPAAAIAGRGRPASQPPHARRPTRLLARGPDQAQAPVQAPRQRRRDHRDARPHRPQGRPPDEQKKADKARAARPAPSASPSRRRGTARSCAPPPPPACCSC